MLETLLAGDHNNVNLIPRIGNVQISLTALGGASTLSETFILENCELIVGNNTTPIKSTGTSTTNISVPINAQLTTLNLTRIRRLDPALKAGIRIMGDNGTRVRGVLNWDTYNLDYLSFSGRSSNSIAYYPAKLPRSITRLNYLGTLANSSFNHMRDWDTSRIVNMDNMMNNSASPNSQFNLDLSHWDVSNVTSHTNYDQGCTNWAANRRPLFPT